ncbi:hypothetical protein TIFTF001_037843 [Ficus carica]|uniref:Uncharacterized protein n=1 Tax=Ficus carica TaxID=3494 RepID=A0AA88E7R3_FICCA|nr:hypothetical protein TIFTF001_037843 [Ficus carica]
MEGIVTYDKRSFGREEDGRLAARMTGQERSRLREGGLHSRSLELLELSHAAFTASHEELVSFWGFLVSFSECLD